MGPSFVNSQGNSEQVKQWFCFLILAQLQILQNLFSLGIHPWGPFGHLPANLLGQTSQPIPQTPIVAIYKHSSIRYGSFIGYYHNIFWSLYVKFSKEKK